MVFRKENKVDAFQRQISALRQQLGTDEAAEEVVEAVTEPFDDHGRDRERVEAGSGRGGGSPAEGVGFGTREAPASSFGGYGGTSAGDQGMEPEQPMAPALPAIPAPALDAPTSVIAHDAVWKGDLQSEGTIHVHGRIEGSITAKHDIYIAEEADVDATVTASNVVVAGLVKGTVRCEARFEVLPQGRVAGDIQAPTLVIHEGATVTGQFRMGAAEATARPEPQATDVVQRRSARGGD